MSTLANQRAAQKVQKIKVKRSVIYIDTVCYSHEYTHFARKLSLNGKVWWRVARQSCSQASLHCFFFTHIHTVFNQVDSSCFHKRLASVIHTKEPITAFDAISTQWSAICYTLLRLFRSNVSSSSSIFSKSSSSSSLSSSC